MYSDFHREFLNAYQQFGAIIALQNTCKRTLKGEIKSTDDFIQNTRSDSELLGMSGSGLPLLCTHIRDVNENILDRVYSALRLMAHTSAEMDVNSLLFLSAAPLLGECW